MQHLWEDIQHRVPGELFKKNEISLTIGFLDRFPSLQARHERICAKSSQKRKAFDSTKQRQRGTDLEHFLATHKPTAHKTKKGKRDWREKHEEFVESLRAAREVTIAMKEGQ